MSIQKLFTLGNSFVVLGIVFGCGDRLVGYSFIGAGVLLSIIGGLKLRRESKAQTHRTGGA
jgi:hypothetical protein